MNSILNDTVYNDRLFGKDREEGIVGAYQLSDTHIRLFIREGEMVVSRDDLFYPFFFLSDSSLLTDFVPDNKGKYWLVPLDGSNYFRFLAIFKSWRSYRAALDFVNSRNSGNALDSELLADNGLNNHLTYNKGDAVTQYLLQSGKTMFKGMIFEDLHRLQLDIETYYNPEAIKKSGFGEDPVIIVSLSDNRSWEHVIHSKGRTEKALLEELIRILEEKDPDVIEGHNIFGFDLPYLQKRCELHGVPFCIGRDRLVPKSFPASIRFAERTYDFQFFDIPGRHVVDTLFLVQNYDISKRAMPGYGLKVAAKYFGFASPNRTYVEYKDIISTWDNNPERLLAYALDDVRETRELSSLLSGSNFYMTMMLPYTYAQTSRLGPAAKIEAMFVREYLRHKSSIPKPSSGQQHAGGYTEVFLKGILGPVVYADVESLYPSIMLSYNVCPGTDERKVFPTVLHDLKEMRFTAKKHSAEEKLKGNSSLAANFDAMQGSFKILINAMYGYLGFSNGIFNDYEEADRVTSTGQEIARSMIREFESRGCKVIEVDTDGIFLVPPPSVISEEQEAALVEEVSLLMPEGINIGFEGRYRKMISYMKKNYVLLNYDGSMKLKGSSLISRSSEKFGRDFVREGFRMLLEEDIAGLHHLYIKFRNDILHHRLDVSEFSRTEALKTTLDQYMIDVKSGKRSKSITYEIAIKQRLPVAKGERITFYVSGSGTGSGNYDKGKLAREWTREQPDENSHFYLKRLDEHAQKFLPFFKPQDFSTIFSADTLFSFSDEGIQLIKEVRHLDTGTLFNDDVPF